MKAGLNIDVLKKYLSLLENKTGSKEEQIKILRKRRFKLLEDIHEKQQSLDELDYMIDEIKRRGSNDKIYHRPHDGGIGRKKKRTAILLSLFMVLGLAACSQTDAPETPGSSQTNTENSIPESEDNTPESEGKATYLQTAEIF